MKKERLFKMIIVIALGVILFMASSCTDCEDDFIYFDEKPDVYLKCQETMSNIN